MDNSTCSTQSSIWVRFALCAMRKMQAAEEMRRQEACAIVQSTTCLRSARQAC